MRFLVAVASYSDKNMMTPTNLGIVFSPNVLQSPDEADVFRQFEVFHEFVDFEVQAFSLIFNFFFLLILRNRDSGRIQNESHHANIHRTLRRLLSWWKSGYPLPFFCCDRRSRGNVNSALFHINCQYYYTLISLISHCLNGEKITETQLLPSSWPSLEYRLAEWWKMGELDLRLLSALEQVTSLE